MMNENSLCLITLWEFGPMTVSVPRDISTLIDLSVFIDTGRQQLFTSLIIVPLVLCFGDGVRIRSYESSRRKISTCTEQRRYT